MLIVTGHRKNTVEEGRSCDRQSLLIILDLPKTDIQMFPVFMCLKGTLALISEF